MSEEDTEFRDLVAQSLEEKGILNKIRAELRANVFLALEEQEATSKLDVTNKQLNSFLETREGHQAFSLIREFLQFFNLDFTLAVLEPESNSVGKASSREDLENQLNMTKCDPKQPLLLEFLNRREEHSPTHSHKKNGSTSKIPRRVKEQPSPISNDKENNPPMPELYITNDFDKEDDLLKELGVSPLSFGSLDRKTKQQNWMSEMEVESPFFDKSPPNRQSDLGSLVDAPALPGVIPKVQITTLDVVDPEWDELLKIDEKITELGFEIPIDDITADDEDKVNNNNNNKEIRYSYDDDFLSLDKSEKLSVTEEIEGDISIGSFAHSQDEEEEDIQTTDETVSKMLSFDHAEDAEDAEI